MSNGFFIGARGVLAMMALGFIGDVFRNSEYQSVSASNAAPQAAQVQTIVVDTAANSTDYPVTIDGVTVTYTSDASATKAEISAGLKAAIDAEPGHRVTVVDDLTDTLTITGKFPGIENVISTTSGNLTIAEVTAADEADPLYPGRVVIRTGEVESLSGNFPVKSPVAADFTAQSAEVTITTGAAAAFEAVIGINGATYRSGIVAHTTDAATTAAAIVSAINGVLPANTVLASNALGVLTFTAEVPGAEFTVDVRPSGVLADVEVTAAVGPSSATSLKRALLGMTVRRLDTEAADLGGNSILPGLQGVEVTRRGRMVVERATAEAWLAESDLFVGVAAATSGKLFNSAGANRVHIGRDLITVDRSADNNLGLVRITTGA